MAKSKKKTSDSPFKTVADASIKAKAEKPKADVVEEVVVAKDAPPPQPHKAKVKVRSLVTTSCRNGATRIDLEEGKTYEFSEEMAAWLVRGNKCI